MLTRAKKNGGLPEVLKVVSKSMAEIHALYNHGKGCSCGCGGNIMPVALAGDTQIAEVVYSQGEKATAEVLDKLQQRYAGGFDGAINTSFGSGRQYPDLERQLRLNVSNFGTYKAYDVVEKLQQLRRGNVSKDEYDKQAKTVLDVYNGYQKSEYNTLVARSRTAKQFQRFREERNLYPNIEWLRTRSATPRETHLEYVGIILPQNDPFWNENQPGNEWGCKCDWRTTDKPTTAAPVNAVPPALGLNGNPAETGELVTDSHPYFTRNRNAPQWVQDKAVLQAPDSAVFTRRETSQGSPYYEHMLLSAQEKADNRFFAEILADNGYKNIELLPTVNTAEKRLRNRYYGSIGSLTKCPDARIGSTRVEFKATARFDRRNVNQLIKDANEKAEMVVVHIKEAVAYSELERVATRQFTLRERLNRIFFYNNGELVKFTRKSKG